MWRFHRETCLKAKAKQAMAHSSNPKLHEAGIVVKSSWLWSKSSIKMKFVVLQVVILFVCFVQVNFPHCFMHSLLFFFCFFSPFFHISLITFNYKIWKKDLLRDYHGVSEQFVDDLLNLLSVENAHAYRWDMSSVRESSLFCDNFKIWNFNMLFFSTATSNARK